ncbi:mRNA splicing protein [Coemansia sp. RSA 2711]|nr:mRNA splicing protein [Coemansia sp. RSA 2711]KAJ2311109.1 mRNA splicing protein [Coemansia sp. RSA 2705]KAJ2318794.1 mRNA splicing protein [Coemansia sp. RSA 2704]
MSSISQFLPEPKHPSSGRQHEEAIAESSQALVAPQPAHEIPAYGQRSGWVPKTSDDFGDGGAYPEIAMLQYPLGMGRKRSKKGNALAKQVDGNGNVSYDALVRHGRRPNEVVHSQFKDMIPLRQRADFDDNQEAIPERPDAETVRETTERTKQALEKALGKHTGAKVAKPDREPTYIRYTPNQQGPGFNSGAAQRIVRVSDMPVDPMEPPKIRHQKKARKPASPPAPVMHSPPRKLTAEEQKEWSVPPCVSNWKNIHGFTVSLDKRLAADGRGIEELSVSDNFSRLAEALISAESNARKEIAERSQVQQALARKEKEAKEENLRMLAQRAREERAAANFMQPTESAGYEPPPMSRSPSPIAQQQQPSRSPSPPTESRKRAGRMGAADFFDERSSKRRSSRSPDAGLRQRDEQRRERRKQHEREQRQSRTGRKLREDRDISEKIALGIAKPTQSGEMFDSRLFNQPSASNAALHNDEAYNLYDKPLFNASRPSTYRPHAAIDEENRASEVDRMMSSDRFGSQLQGMGSKKSEQPRSGPVEFEKGDVFGIDAFANTARQAKDKR